MLRVLMLSGGAILILIAANIMPAYLSENWLLTVAGIVCLATGVTMVLDRDN